MKVFHFRPYTLHLGRYELSRGTIMLPLPRIAMEIFILLVERRGDLVTRQEIAARVWPGSHPEDVFQSINTAINRIRSTLRDDAANPKYVQTVIGKGYRFMAAVEEMDLVEEVSPSPSVSRTDLVAVEADYAGAVGSGNSLSTQPAMGARAIAAPSFQIDTVISPVGLTAEVEPSIQKPALARRWRLAAVLALVVTAVAAFALWRRLADVSSQHRGAFKLSQITDNGPDEPITAMAISPDGKSLAYADTRGVHLRLLRGTALPLRTPGLVDVRRIEWFPDGRRIVVSATASSTHTPQIWSVSLGDEAPRLIRDGAELGVPSPDGSQVAFTVTDDTAATTFWTSDAVGGNETKIDTGEHGDSYSMLLWSADARKLILEEIGSPSSSTNPKTSVGAEESGSAHRLIVIDIQSHIETSAVDGIAFSAACLSGSSGVLFAGSVNGSRYKGLWRVDLDPETGAPLAAPVQVQLVENVLALSRSADDQAVALIRKTQPDVYMATLSQPGPTLTNVKRITSNPVQDYPQAWTSDSRSVLFEANDSVQGGSAFHIYRQAIDGPPEALVSNASVQVLPQQSPDGRWILFASKQKWLSGEPYTLYRVAEAGGTPMRIDLGGPLDEYRCPLSGKSCILRETEGHRAFHYYALDPVAGKGRLLCSTPWTEGLLWNWNVSPDGKEIALPVIDPLRPRIRLVPCDGGDTASATREMPVKIAQALMEVTWAADGQGWFVSAAATPQGADLFYVHLDGSATFLRHDNPLWGVPSPDGRKLAFVGETVDSNVWLLQ